MLTLEKIYPLEDIIPLCEPNAPFIIDGLHVTKPKVVKLIKKQGTHCAICNEPAKEFHLLKDTDNNTFIMRLVFNKKDKYNQYVFMNVDHIIPKSKKGANDFNNLQLTCNICNTYKADKLLSTRNINYKSDWLTRLFYISLINFYIIQLEKDLTVKGFMNAHDTIFKYVRKYVSKQPNFNQETWDDARHSVINKISYYKTGKVINIL